jgi:hypothetical protein
LGQGIETCVKCVGKTTIPRNERIFVASGIWNIFRECIGIGDRGAIHPKSRRAS